LIDGELVVNPKISEMDKSTLDLRVAGTAEAINMVECGAVEVSEETVIAALMLAHQIIQQLVAVQIEMAQEVGKPKYQPPLREINVALMDDVSSKAREGIRQVLRTYTERDARGEALEALYAEVKQGYALANAGKPEEEQISLKEVGAFLEDILKQEVRTRIIVDGIRPDNRGYTEIRPLSAEVNILPRVHGTGFVPAWTNASAHHCHAGNPS
jgi:polyribonucleotide nucleotidyltransferase